MTDHAPRFRHLGGDRWEWTPQRVLDQRDRDREHTAWLLEAMRPAARHDIDGLHELWGGDQSADPRDAKKPYCSQCEGRGYMTVSEWGVTYQEACHACAYDEPDGGAPPE